MSWFEDEPPFSYRKFVPEGTQMDGPPPSDNRERLMTEMADSIRDLLGRRLNLEPMERQLLPVECATAALTALEMSDVGAQAFTRQLGSPETT